ncbi:hypothetical protein [Echinicola jeungdonensis]|uniref:hypothetical protein n=1 Tax=Echinicola jeungdonensis TaxID=709343 RepID=UPI003F49AEED
MDLSHRLLKELASLRRKIRTSPICGRMPKPRLPSNTVMIMFLKGSMPSSFPPNMMILGEEEVMLKDQTGYS